MIFNGKSQTNKSNTMTPKIITLQKWSMRSMGATMKRKAHKEVMNTMRMIRTDSCDIRIILT